MQQCCNDCFKVCEPLNSCPAEFFIFCPPDYNESEVIIQITKPGVNVRVRQLLTLDWLGFVQVDLTTIPAGFLNPYAGQYELKFIHPVSNEPVTFTGSDGNTYSNVCLTFAQTATAEDNVLVLNVFTDNLP